MDNRNYNFAIYGFLSGGLLVYMFYKYKTLDLEKKIDKLEKINSNLIEHMMYLDSTPCNSSYIKNEDTKNIPFENYKDINSFNDNID